VVVVAIVVVASVVVVCGVRGLDTVEGGARRREEDW